MPIARLVDPVMSQRMAEYALYGTLRFHRQFDLYERQNREMRWERHFHPDPAGIGVGVMGAGEIGMAAARLLRAVGYDVAGLRAVLQCPMNSARRDRRNHAGRVADEQRSTP